jgi:hypothetical protein
MQALLQPQFVKVPSATTRNQVMQPKTLARPTTKKQTGRRFLDCLLAALSAVTV